MMHILNIFGGRIYQINKLTKKVINFNTEKLSNNVDFEDTVLIMAAGFAQKVLADVFDPKHNALIKHVNQIDENDMNSVYCVLIAHFIYRFFRKPFLFYKSADDIGREGASFDKYYTVTKFEKKLYYTEEEYRKFEEREIIWSMDLEWTKLENLFGISDSKIIDCPTIKMIANHCHIYSDVTLSKKIMSILLSSYNYTKEIFAA